MAQHLSVTLPHMRRALQDFVQFNTKFAVKFLPAEGREPCLSTFCSAQKPFEYLGLDREPNLWPVLFRNLRRPAPRPPNRRQPAVASAILRVQ